MAYRTSNRAAGPRVLISPNISPRRTMTFISPMSYSDEPRTPSRTPSRTLSRTQSAGSYQNAPGTVPLITPTFLVQKHRSTVPRVLISPLTPEEELRLHTPKHSKPSHEAPFSPAQQHENAKFRGRQSHSEKHSKRSGAHSDGREGSRSNFYHHEASHKASHKVSHEASHGVPRSSAGGSAFRQHLGQHSRRHVGWRSGQEPRIREDDAIVHYLTKLALKKGCTKILDRTSFGFVRCGIQKYNQRQHRKGKPQVPVRAVPTRHPFQDETYTTFDRVLAKAQTHFALS